MRGRTLRLLVLGTVLLLMPVLAFAVPKVIVEPPAGYAQAKTSARGLYWALSPEGLPFRVRTFENDPVKNTEFWSETLKLHLQKEGYRPNGEGESFQAGENQGMVFEWVVPYNNESYLYLTALIVTEKWVILAEAAGPYKQILPYREGLRESLESIRLSAWF